MDIRSAGAGEARNRRAFWCETPMAKAGRQEGESESLTHNRSMAMTTRTGRTMIEWLCQHIVKLEDAFSEPLARLNRRLRSQGGISVGDGSDSR